MKCKQCDSKLSINVVHGTKQETSKRFSYSSGEAVREKTGSGVGGGREEINEQQKKATLPDSCGASSPAVTQARAPTHQ